MTAQQTQQQRRTFPFDTRSVMLFAALSLSGMGALHAQASPPPVSQYGPAGRPPLPTTQSQTGSPSPSGPAARTPLSTATTSMAFDRADTNQDGQLSAREAAQLPAIGQRFKELDSDGNGSLSRAEFEKGANS